jgi:formamidopyrimidine-DNA glycosylase
LPELPDVESFRKYFERDGLNHKIKSFQIYSSKIVRDSKKTSQLVGKKFVSTSRLGKNLFIDVSDGTTMVVHFGMTGFFHFFTKTNPHQRFTRYLITFDHKKLAYVDMRLLGFMTITDDLDDYIKKRDLGPDALEISYADFQKLFSEKTPLKKLLMEQSKMAGIGNVYADEILFQAKEHPLKKANSLSEIEIRKLYKTMRSVFKKAIAIDAETERMPKKWLIPVRKKREVCPLCGTELEMMKVMTRGTYICPSCQRI